MPTATSMPETRIESIKALAELDRLGWTFEPAGDDNVKLKCPIHDDDRASASLSTAKNLWRCHTGSCGGKGDIVTLLAAIAGTTRSAMLVDLGTRYDLTTVKQISPESVEKLHAAVWKAGPLLTELYKRGVTDDMIRAARIGYQRGRLTIPVTDQSGRYVNVRRYLPGAAGADKMRNARGFGTMRLYQIADLPKADKVWVCGGELKALVVKHMLGSGFAAVSATSGEGNWDATWSTLFAGKQVWVCMDVDKAGRTAARKVAKALSTVAQSVKIIKLPLDLEKYPTGDINDYVAAGASREDMLLLMNNAEDFKREVVEATTVEVVEEREVTLRNATHEDHVNARVVFEAVPTAADTTPYLIPKTVRAVCGRAQGALCVECAVHDAPLNDDGDAEIEVPSWSSAILEMIDAPAGRLPEAQAAAIGAPRSCKELRTMPMSYHAAHDVRLSPILDIAYGSAGSEASIRQPALVVGQECELNTPYRFSGRVFPHPRTQQATLVLDKVALTKDGLANFQPTEEQLAELKVFQPKKWTLDALRTQLNTLYTEIEHRVTGIFGRRDLHTLIDLAFHSPLFVKVRGRKTNGWINVLVLGDSAQGKTETTMRLMDHYGLGERVECKNATVAGLLGGLQQIGTRWYVSWGVIPTHDRRLVVLEEVKGAAPEVLQKLTDMRSSGVAEIPKIERQRTHARTRLVWVSNPRGARSLSSYAFGVEAIYELLGSLEDVRRFDAAIVLAAGEVSEATMNTEYNKTGDGVFTSELCRRLVLWAWTRTSVSSDADKEINEASARMCKLFDEAIPLVDRGTMRHKLTRLAAALAARTFSIGLDGGLVIRPVHVQYVEELLVRCYSTPACGYASYSETKRKLSDLKDPAAALEVISNARYPKDLASGLMERDSINLNDLQDWSGATREGAQEILSGLVRQHALRRAGKMSYAKSPPFIALLREHAGSFVNKEDEF